MSPEKLEEINKLKKAFNIDAVINALLNDIYKDMPDVLKELIKKKFTAEELFQRISAIYDRHFTLEDLRDLNQFYTSSIGMKMITVSPQIACETVTVAREFGEQVANEVAKEIDQINDFFGR